MAGANGVAVRFALAALVSLAGCAGPVAPELVIVNAKVFTNDSARPWAEAVAVRGERVIGVGSSAEVRAAANQATRVIDAGGRVLIPGFNDARVDLPLEPPTPDGLSALDRAAIEKGVTSLQVVAGGAMRTLVPAAQQAQREARWRLIRSPMDTATLSTSDPAATLTEDEDPYLPPQPGVRLSAHGVAWRLTDGNREGRRALASDRVATVVGWAYGAEDPLVMAAGAREWVAALSHTGLPAVWQRKRPRFDIDGIGGSELAADFARLGVTVVWTPALHTDQSRSRPAPLAPPKSHAGSYADAGVRIALGSSTSPDPGATVAAVTGATDSTGLAAGRPLTREEAVRAMTWGSAYAEKTERDKGWIAAGTLADIAVLSDDIFTAPAERLPAITSVLTLVGGTIVYDSGVLSK